MFCIYIQRIASSVSSLILTVSFAQTKRLVKSDVYSSAFNILRYCFYTLFNKFIRFLIAG